MYLERKKCFFNANPLSLKLFEFKFLKEKRNTGLLNNMEENLENNPILQILYIHAVHEISSQLSQFLPQILFRMFFR